MTDANKKIELFRKWFTAPGHFLLFFRIAAWAVLIPLLYRFLSLPSLMRVLTPDKPIFRFTPEAAADTADRIRAYVVRILIQNPKNIRRMCLKRSLVLYRFLRLYGIPSVFFLGVRKEEGKIVGHSWVEVEGEHFCDPMAEVSYTVTYSYPEREKPEK